jgi:hypothetical protein
LKVGKKPTKMNPEMLNLLWNAKDRATTVHKSLRTLQEIYENTDLPSLNEKTKSSMVAGYLKGLLELQLNSLRPLEILFNEFIEKYPNNFAQFCVQTDGRSNWVFFWSHFPKLLPSFIMKSIEEEEEEARKIRALLDTTESNNFPKSLSELLGDISRIEANVAYWLEDTVDDLLSISLFEEWEEMRDRTPEWLRYWEHEHGAGLPHRIEPKNTNDKELETEKTPVHAVQTSKVDLEPKGKFGFVFMPFKANFLRIYEKLIKPTLERNDIAAMKADDIYSPTPISDDIRNYTKKASLIIADVTNDNPNVLYELGQAHALGKETIIITQSERDVPSDFSHIRFLKYDDDEKGWQSLESSLDRAIRSITEKK